MAHVAHVLTRAGKGAAIATSVVAGMAASMSAAAAIILQPFNPPTVFNSAVEIQAEAQTGGTLVAGPQSTFGPVSPNFTTSIQIPRQTVSSSASSGDTSAAGQGNLQMSASISGNSIQGSGSVGSSGTLVQGPDGTPSIYTDATADFDIFFTLTTTEEAKISFSSSIATSQKYPNNLSVVFLEDQSDNSALLLRAESEGNQSQTASYDGLLAPGNYFLRGLSSYEDYATISDNDGGLYNDSGSFSFDLTVTPAPEPATPSLLLLGMVLAGAVVLRRRRSRA
jgi:PEP-CTERM motif